MFCLTQADIVTKLGLLGTPVVHPQVQGLAVVWVCKNTPLHQHGKLSSLDSLVKRCHLFGLVLDVLLLGQLGHAIFPGLILVGTSGNLSSATTSLKFFEKSACNLQERPMIPSSAPSDAP